MRNFSGSKPYRKGKRVVPTLKPELLCLEERVTPATYTITSFEDSGGDTLRKAISQANNSKEDDVIFFSLGGRARTINLKSALPSIEKVGTAGKITIEGPGRTALTLNGNNGDIYRDFRIFNIAEGGDFEVKGITISGARTSGSGAALYNRGGKVDISSCYLTNNIARDWGGAIRNDDGRMDVAHSTISNNTAANGGGISNHFGGTLILNNCKISGNYASDEGGGLFSQSSYALVSYSSLIEGNRSGNDGGGIFNAFGTLNIGNGLNKATITGNATSNGRGGGICNNGGRVTITSSAVSSNKAGLWGGGVFNFGNGFLNVTNSIISENELTLFSGGVRFGGGGISSDTNKGSVTITNSIISGNISSGDGGGIRSIGDGPLTITGNSTITNNIADNDGGGIYSEGFSLMVDSSTISDNQAYGDAGGIYSWHRSVLAIKYSTIKNNTSDGNGGGLFIDGNNYKNSDESYVYYSRIENNESRKGGGIFNDGKLLVFGSTIFSNTALEKSTINTREGCGGGIFNGEQGQLLVYDSTISYNNADIDGGGIAAYRAGAVPFTEVPIPGIFEYRLVLMGINSAIKYLAPKEPFTIFNSTIAYNKANIKTSTYNPTAGHGGGIYTIVDTGIYNCTIVQNTKRPRGLYEDSPVDRGIIDNAAQSGGGLTRANYTAWTTSLLILENTIIANNYGGDIWLEPALWGADSDSRRFGYLTRVIVSDNSFDFIALEQFFDSIVGTESVENFVSYGYYPTDQYGIPNGAFIINPDHSGQSFGDADDIDFIIVPSGLGNGALMDNGGLTSTMALFKGSPAIDQGINVLDSLILSSSNKIAFDQRGYTRDPFQNGYPDIGSFEYQYPPIGKLVTSTKSLSGSTSLSIVDPVTDQPDVVMVPFPGFTGGIHLAPGDYNGDYNGDGIGDILAGAGQGGGPAVAIVDSQTGRVIRAFYAFSPFFTGGVQVDALDYNRDGVMDIIAAAGPGGGPHVKIFNGVDLAVLKSFYAFDKDFRGGVSIAAIDFNGDGIRDVVAGAGPGGGPHVKVFNGSTLAVVKQWYAFDKGFKGGVNVSGGDLNQDGTVEVITGAGPGRSPEVALWNPLTGALISRFLAYDKDFKGGVRVGVADGNGDGIPDLVTGAGPGGSPHVKGFSFSTLDLVFEFLSGNANNHEGVFVG